MAKYMYVIKHPSLTTTKGSVTYVTYTFHCNRKRNNFERLPIGAGMDHAFSDAISGEFMCRCLNRCQVYFIGKKALILYLSRSITQTNKMICAPIDDSDQISLGIRPVWLESSLCAHLTAKDPRFFQADTEDWPDWTGALANLSLCWAHRILCWFCRVQAHFKAGSAAYDKSYCFIA